MSPISIAALIQALMAVSEELASDPFCLDGSQGGDVIGERDQNVLHPIEPGSSGVLELGTALSGVLLVFGDGSES